ncbi:hypothetical protein [Maridesulfovibrio sp.]|uniref:hypothetical protein n=1 Tax=Maridesulfovibrio sp. TaxID=2795000 RepID=UPI0039EE0FEA
MSAGEVSLPDFEMPALYLLALLLDPDGVDGDIAFSSGFGTLRFSRMDLRQERGRIPQLVIDFELDGGKFNAAYFGHVSPFKLHYAEIVCDGLPVQKHIFSEGNEVYIPMAAGVYDGDLPSGVDWRILAGSLFLWRSCLGLPNACDESLGKYFSKMKLVSRYQWINECYKRQGENILETWTSIVPCSGGENLKISILFVDGLISKIEF